MGLFTPFRGSSSPSTKNSMAFRRGNNLTASFASAFRLKLHDAKTFHVVTSWWHHLKSEAKAQSHPASVIWDPVLSAYPADRKASMITSQQQASHWIPLGWLAWRLTPHFARWQKDPHDDGSRRSPGTKGFGHFCAEVVAIGFEGPWFLALVCSSHIWIHLIPFMPMFTSLNRSQIVESSKLGSTMKLMAQLCKFKIGWGMSCAPMAPTTKATFEFCQWWALRYHSSVILSPCKPGHVHENTADFTDCCRIDRHPFIYFSSQTPHVMLLWSKDVKSPMSKTNQHRIAAHVSLLLALQAESGAESPMEGPGLVAAARLEEGIPKLRLGQTVDFGRDEGATFSLGEGPPKNHRCHRSNALFEKTILRVRKTQSLIGSEFFSAPLSCPGLLLTCWTLRLVKVSPTTAANSAKNLGEVRVPRCRSRGLVLLPVEFA